MTDIVVPGSVTPLPAAPNPQTDAQVDFDAKAYAFVEAQVAMVPQINDIAAKMHQNALAAHERAQAADQAKEAAAGSTGQASTHAGAASNSAGQAAGSASAANAAKQSAEQARDAAAAFAGSINPERIEAALRGMRNKIINGDFRIDQYGYASGAATVANQFVRDRWFVTGTGGVTFATANNKTTMTIPAGQTARQVIEGANLQSGVHVLSWEGSALGRVGTGAYGASGSVTANVTGGANVTVEFNAGTVTEVQFERGNVATSFEQRLRPTELGLCQWYRQDYFDVMVCGMAPDAAPRDIFASFIFPQMRAIPTVTFGPASVGVSLLNATGPTLNRNYIDHARIVIATGGAIGTSYWQGRITRSAEITA